ncbi:MAG: hypothetical protein WCQ54_11310 [Clostridiaceae bacterium]
MESIGINNVFSLAIGLSIILCCSLVTYLFQKHLFKKYKNKGAKLKP